jgi:hypothetical protein
LLERAFLTRPGRQPAATLLSLSSGTINFNGVSPTLMNITQSSGTLGGNAARSLSGAYSMTGGTLTGSGAFTVPSGATWNATGSASKFFDNVAFTWTVR